MKKSLIYIFLSLLMLGMISCGDNVLFSEVYELTPEEEAELARQDSIEEALRNRINANIVLEYNLEITISAAQYSGGQVAVNIDTIAALFGISTEDLLLGIAGEAGAPEVKGFAIEGSTHADNTLATNTNSTWGHWWDANGDVVGWGETAMVAAEFDSEAGVFNVVQYPGHLTDGQTIKFIEAIKLEEQRVAIVINVTAKAGEQLEVEVVSTQDITVELAPHSTYDADPIDFDLNQVLTDLGISSILDEASFVGLAEDGSFAEEYTADPSGFWYDMAGFASVWGDDASVYVTYEAYEDNQIGIGQYPDHMSDGQTVELQFGFLANDKIVMLNITINFVGGEEPGGGEPNELGIVNTQYLTINVTPKNTYDTDLVVFDLDQTLADLEISSMDEATFVGINEDGTINEAYTADGVGYWYDMNGWVGNWGDDASVYTAYGAFEANQVGIGQYPEHLTGGEVIEINYGIKANDKIEMLNITITVIDYEDPEDQPTGDPVEVEESFDVTLTYASDWSANSRVDVKEILRNAFKMTTFQINTAISNGELVFSGVNTDGSVYTDADGNPVSTANYPGHWFGIDGNVTVWGDTGNMPIVYCELAHTESVMELSVGLHPDNAKSGDTVTFTQIAELNGGKATFTINFTVE